MFSILPTDLSIKILQTLELDDHSLATISTVCRDAVPAVDACFSPRGRTLRAAWTLARGENSRPGLSMPENTIGNAVLQAIKPKLRASDAVERQGALDQLKRLVNISERLEKACFGLAATTSNSFEADALLRLSDAGQFVTPALRSLAEAMNASASTCYRVIDHILDSTSTTSIEELDKAEKFFYSLISHRLTGEDGACQIIIGQGLQIQLSISCDFLRTAQNESFDQGLNRILQDRTGLDLAFDAPFRRFLFATCPTRSASPETFDSVFRSRYQGVKRHELTEAFSLTRPINFHGGNESAPVHCAKIRSSDIDIFVELVHNGRYQRSAGEYIYLNEERVTKTSKPCDKICTIM